VDTVKELKLRKPAPLHAKMLEIHNQKNLVRRLPTEPMVAAWIAAATQLPAVIKS
jgi:hypothetical protein